MMRIIMAASLLALIPLDARAQSAGPGVNELFVRSSDGVEVRGQLIELRHTSLSLFVEGTRRDIPFETIDRIQTRGDGVLNGALIGAAIGAGLWGVAMANSGGHSVPTFLGASIGYGLIGAAVDAMIPGRTTIYSKPPADDMRSYDRRATLGFRIGF